MRQEKIDLIKKCIEILSKDVFGVANRIDGNTAIATMAVIKILEEVLSNKAIIDKHSGSTEEFARNHEAFLQELIQRIENKELFGTIMIQTQDEDPKNRIDVCMSTMDEERIIQAISSFFIKYGPSSFVKFLKYIMGQLGGEIRMIPIPFPPPGMMHRLEEEEDESSPNMGKDEE